MANPATRPATRLLQKISLIILGIFLAVILLESCLRLGGFIILSLQEYRNTLAMKHKDSYRILCVGESTTQNQYPSFLEETLNRRNIGVKFSVIDKGLAATNTSNILSNMENYLAEYKPDMVVAMMGINDFGKHMPLETQTSSRPVLFLRSLRIYKLSRLLWLHLVTRMRDPGPASGSEDSFKQAIALNPQDPSGYVGLGGVYYDQVKLSLAEINLKQAIAFNTRDSVCYMRLGWVYHDQVKLSLAEETFKQGLALNPRDSDCYMGLGWTYYDEGKFSLAEEAFKQGLAVNPRNIECYARLGWLYYEQGKFFLAEDIFKQAIVLNPQADKLHGFLALLYEKQGRVDLANEYYAKADALRIKEYDMVTANNYHKLKEILENNKVRLVSVQYPLRSVNPLRNIFGRDNAGIIFVSNEQSFKDAVRREGYMVYFRDMFNGDFGHCTDKGNQLLAENIAEAILKEAFNR